MTDVKEILTELVDEIISISIVMSTIILLVFGYSLPEWWIGAFGLVIGHFFTKSASVNGTKPPPTEEIVEKIINKIKEDCVKTD